MQTMQVVSTIMQPQCKLCGQLLGRADNPGTFAGLVAQGYIRLGHAKNPSLKDEEQCAFVGSIMRQPLQIDTLDVE